MFLPKFFLTIFIHHAISDFALGSFMAKSGIDLEKERSYPTPVKDSPLLKDLVVSLAQQKNSPNTSPRIDPDYDYIIVGAGTAGSVVAARLSEISCVSVLLLEAGSSPPMLNDVVGYAATFWLTNLDWHYKTTPQKHSGGGLNNRQMNLRAGKGPGGSSLLNDGVYVRGNKKDYNDWEEMGAEGWSYQDVLPYFKKAEANRNFEFMINGYHGFTGPMSVTKPRYEAEIKSPILQAAQALGYQLVDPNAERQTGFYDFQSNLRNGQRCNAAKAYLVPVENRPNLNIVTGAFVKKVITENGRATGVLFDYKNLPFRIRAKREVILSAGAIRTPQILMLSGIGPVEQLMKFNIPVHANLPVGENYHDHGGIPVDFVLKPHIQPFSAKLSDERCIKQYIRDRSGPVATVAGVQYAAFLLNDAINPEIDFPNYELYIGESSAKGLKTYGNLKPEVYEQVYKPYENRSTMACRVQLLHPKSRGSIQLQSENPYDDPSIDPNFLADPSDVEDLLEGMKTCKRICNGPEMNQVISQPFQTLVPGCEAYANNEDEYLRCVIRNVMTSYTHYCCTARMGHVDSPTTVVDPKLRVKNINSLRVVDASVMPKLTSGNTETPVLMIGEKAADLIKESIIYDRNYQK